MQIEDRQTDMTKLSLFTNYGIAPNIMIWATFL
jgi:hypothetical protein